MKAALATLLPTILLALVGLIGVREPMASIVQVAFFSLVVLFVIAMVRLLAPAR